MISIASVNCKPGVQKLDCHAAASSYSWRRLRAGRDGLPEDRSASNAARRRERTSGARAGANVIGWPVRDRTCDHGEFADHRGEVARAFAALDAVEAVDTGALEECVRWLGWLDASAHNAPRDWKRRRSAEGCARSEHWLGGRRSSSARCRERPRPPAAPDDSFAVERGSGAGRILLTRQTRRADSGSEGTSAIARECPRVTGVYDLDK
jgi:hypothetical protein